MIIAATWLFGAAAVIVVNLNDWATVAMPTALGALLGGMAAMSTAALIAQRDVRPIMLAAIEGSDGRIAAPDVLTRLVVTWLLCSTVPCMVIAGLIVVRPDRWISPSERHRDSRVGGGARRGTRGSARDVSDFPIDS